MNVAILEAFCRSIAEEEHTLLDIRRYNEYGWESISFATDKFGGTYVSLHVDLETGKVHNWYKTDEEQEIRTIEQLQVLVHKENELLKKIRSKSVSEMINSQYD